MSRPDFTTKNVIQDKGMMSAFQEGVTEGQANRQSITVWDVIVSFEGTKLNERRFEVRDDMEKFVMDNLDTPGQEVTVKVRWVPANYVSEGTVPELAPGDDEIVDAEVIED